MNYKKKKKSSQEVMKARNYQFINFFIDYLVDHDN